MEPSASAPKAEWRRWARALPPVPAEAAAAVVARLRAFLGSVEGPVLAYAAMAGEVPLDGLEHPALCLPRLGDGEVLTVHASDAREHHALGFDQPPAGLPVIEPATLAAVVVPGRVFDRHGYRLGRGGGHYDRLLPLVAPGVPVLGVTIESRIVERLPREPHDVPMTHLATDAGITQTNSTR